jgi:type I restriction enzyme, R subunit
MTEYKTIAETNRFIVLDRYDKDSKLCESYQSEDALERELIADLLNLGYTFDGLNSPEKLLANARVQLQTLNNVQFTESEWLRFVETYLDRPSDNIVEKTRKIHDDFIHDFVFDDGHIQNIYLLDKKNVLRNTCQIIRQFEQAGSHANRYDVTILVNGLPLVHVELKKRGVAIREAFNQVHRYSKESFNSENSLFKYLQLFVISNGTDTRYFANTTQRDKNSFDFTMHWATKDNSLIKDLKDFTATFFEKRTLLKVLLQYSVFDVGNNLLVTIDCQKINSSRHRPSALRLGRRASPARLRWWGADEAAAPDPVRRLSGGNPPAPGGADGKGVGAKSHPPHLRVLERP